MKYELLYIVLCCALAYVNYRVIASDLKVYHSINGVIHIACWVAVYLLTRNWLIVFALPFLGRLFFDTMLNLYRGLPINYVSPWVKNSDKRSSIVDKIEWRLFKDGLLPKVVYLVIVIVLNILA